MRTRIAVIFIVALTLTGVLLSCNGLGAIYSTIETEKKTPVSTLNPNITVLDLVNTGATRRRRAPVFRRRGGDFQRDPGGWGDRGNRLAEPGTFPRGHNSAAKRGPLPGASSLPNYPTDKSLYGGFFTSDGSLMGLYQSVPNGSTYTFQGGTQVTGRGTVDLTGKADLPAASGKRRALRRGQPCPAERHQLCVRARLLRPNGTHLGTGTDPWSDRAEGTRHRGRLRGWYLFRYSSCLPVSKLDHAALQGFGP